MHKLSLALILILAGCPCLAQQASYDREIGFKNDNDVYLFDKQDQYYTNGIQFYFRKAQDSSRLSANIRNSILEFSIGQNIYNSFTAQINWIEDVDRPITAYLFANASINRFYTDESALSIGAEIGLIGKYAFGKQIQQTFHRIFNLYETAGWEYQLNGAAGLDLNAGYMRKLYANRNQRFDIHVRSDASLGMNHTGLAVAPVFRAGSINPMSQSAYVNSRIQSSGKKIAKELFIYYSPQIKAVFYDATTQGGLFLHDKGPFSVKPETWLLSHNVGIMYAYRHLTVNFHYIFNTREIKTMYYRHQYGSLSLLYAF